MRHSAVTFTKQAQEQLSQTKWDRIFCSDMLNLAEFLGLTRQTFAYIPTVVYFHENQLTYPVVHEKDYDYHFAFSNMNTALVANQVWFNSAFHRDSFLSELNRFLRRMPDHQPLDVIDTISGKSEIHYPGIDDPGRKSNRTPGPLRILWAARWEHDKNPHTFFKAMEMLAETGIDFQISVIGGGNARGILPVFEQARAKLQNRIIHWGYLDSRVDYLDALQNADVAISTAEHEFFGIAMIEAISAGAYPLAPNRLAYPEVLSTAGKKQLNDFLYDGSEHELVRKLQRLAEQLHSGDIWNGKESPAQKMLQKFSWQHTVPIMDQALEEITVS